jgi:hypothetical protein
MNLKTGGSFSFPFLQTYPQFHQPFSSKEMKDYFKEFKTASIDGRCKQTNKQGFEIMSTPYRLVGRTTA